MKHNYIVIFFYYLLSLVSYEVNAQDSLVVKQDTIQHQSLYQKIKYYFEEAKVDKSESKFDISFIGGPSYSVDTKLGIGIVASGLYRLDKENLDLSPSNVSIYTNFTTSGFFSVGIENNTIFPDDKFRINSDISFTYMPSKYFGIGYEAGARGIYTTYDQYRISLNVDALAKIIPNGFVGITVSAQSLKGANFNDSILMPNQKLNNSIAGAGFILSYDSRDFTPNPYKGILIQYQHSFFPEALGTTSFNRIEATVRAFKKVLPKTILAFDLNGTFNNGNVPWSMLSQIGGSRQMRGYEIGQYRDRKEMNTQIEIRQKIYNRHGIVLWGGMGNVFDKFDNFKWSQTLPNYGIGYRWEFKNRVNIRFDYGFAKGQGGFYFNINEAF